MGSEWTKYTIQELIDEGIITAHKDGNYGSMYPRQSEFGDTGVLFLTAKLVSDQGFIDFGNAPRLNNEKAEKLTFGYIKSKDVLLSHNATVGRVAITPELTEPVLVGTSLTYFRTDNDRLLPEYFAAYLTGVDFQNELKAVMGLSTRNQVPITTQRKLEVVIPPLPEQKAIAHILGSLDDKIELNRRMNATLEGLAQALFQSWFVDFDPVLDNALAAGNPIPDELTDRAAVRRQALDNGTANREAAQHFPASFQLTEELGWIPEGWKAKELSCFGKIVTGKTPPKAIKNAFGNQSMFLTPTDYDGNIFTIDTVRRLSSQGEESIKNSKIEKGSICVTCIGSQMGRTTYVYEEAFTNQQINSISPKILIHRNYLLFNLRLRRNEIFAIGSSGSTMPIVNKSMFSKLPILCPNEIELEIFNHISNSHLAKIVDNIFQIQTLTKLRDTLLPQLISGELRIPDAAKLAEAALA